MRRAGRGAARQLGLLALLAALAVTLLLLRRVPDREGGAAVRAPARGSSPAAAPAGELAGAGDEHAPRVSAADTSRGEPDGATAELEPAARPAAPTAPTRDVRGLLLEAEGGLPVAGATLAFRRTYGGDRTDLAQVTTDEAGRFACSALPCDELYVRCVVDLEDPSREGVGFWLEPSGFSLAPEPSGAPLELVLRARRPGCVLEVDVRRPDGSPAPGARVYLGLVERDPASGRPLSTDSVVPVNSRGRARFALASAEAVLSGTLHARGDDGTVSAPLPLESPLAPGVRVLVLGPAGEIHLRARFATGEPAAGLEVWLQGPVGHEADGPPEYRRGRSTDEQGACVLRGLLPGEHVVCVLNPRTGGLEAGPPVRVAPGDVLEVELELSDGPRRIGAEGRVLDEAGAPLAEVELAVLPSEGWPDEVRTDERGAFTWWGRPCEAVELRLDVSPHSDAFEPPSSIAPFGARGRDFRRRAPAADVSFRLEVTDRATGERLTDAIVTFDRGPGTEAWRDSFAPRELYHLRAHPDARARVAAVGHVTATFPLAAALRAAGGDPPLLLVALDPGLDFELSVQDEQTDAPLEGALFVSETAPAARTDADGRVRLAADHWPVYRVTREGYEPVDWDPVDAVPWGDGVLYLSPRE